MSLIDTSVSEMCEAITADASVVFMGVLIALGTRYFIGVCSLVTVMVKYGGARAGWMLLSRGGEWRKHWYQLRFSTVFVKYSNERTEAGRV